MLDHVSEEEEVELGAERGREFLELFLRQHAGHVMLVAGGAHVDHQVQAVDLHLRYRLAASSEPPLHENDLVALGVDDARGEGFHRQVSAMRRSEL